MTALDALPRGRHRQTRTRLHRRVLARFRAARQRRHIEEARDEAYVVRIEAHAVPPLARARAVVAAYATAYGNAVAGAHGVPPAAVLPDAEDPRWPHLDRPQQWDGDWPTGAFRAQGNGWL